MKFISSYLYNRKNRNKFKEFFLSIPKVTNLFFDVGANIGEKTSEYLDLGKKVIAIEPQKDCLESLKEKFADNNNVVIVEAGVGEKQGKETLFVSSRYKGFSSINKDWQKGTKYGGFEKSEKIQIVTVESLIREFGIPDFCKIDVEGYELQVLKGITSKIPYISFEYHGNTLPAARSCIDRLTKLGFKRFNLCESDAAPDDSNWLTVNKLIASLNEKSTENPKIWGDIYAN